MKTPESRVQAQAPEPAAPKVVPISWNKQPIAENNFLIKRVIFSAHVSMFVNAFIYSFRLVIDLVELVGSVCIAQW